MKSKANAVGHPTIVLVISFVVGIAVSWLVVAHFRHTILQEMYGGTNNTAEQLYPEEEVATAGQQSINNNSGCSCPSCCVASSVF